MTSSSRRNRSATVTICFDQALPGRPRRTGTSRITSVTWLVNSAAMIDGVSGQRRYTVGRLTPARRAISASVTRSTPKSMTQLAAAASIRSPVSEAALLIDSICNTVTHDAPRATPSADEMERVGRSRRGQTAVRRDPIAAEAGRRPGGFGRGRTRTRPGQLRPSALSQADQDALAAIVGAEYCAPPTATGCCAPAASPPPTCCGARTPAPRTRPTRYCCPATTTPSPRSCGYCSEHGIAVIPFGGGTNVTGGLDPTRGPFKAVVSLDLRRFDQLHLPRRGVRHGRVGRRRHRPGRRTSARRTRLLARAFPAELRIRHHRRFRGDPVVRPGLGRLRPIQRHDSRAAHGHSGRHAGPGPRRGVGGRPGPAPAGDRLRGRVGRHHQGAPAGAPGTGDRPVTRRGHSPISRPAQRPCGPSPKSAPAPPSSGSPTRPRPESISPPPRRSAKAQITGGCLGLTLFEGTKEHAESRHAETARAAGGPRRHVAGRRARRGPGSAAGSPRRICATRCWPRARSARPSRPPPTGRTSSAQGRRHRSAHRPRWPNRAHRRW